MPCSEDEVSGDDKDENDDEVGDEKGDDRPPADALRCGVLVRPLKLGNPICERDGENKSEKAEAD